ncbi:MAG: hypothetical protein WCV67_10135 [Victivallaceae bacterium]
MFSINPMIRRFAVCLLPGAIICCGHAAAAAGIANDKIALDVNNGKAVLSYRINGQTVPAADFQIAGNTIKGAVEEKKSGGSAIAIEYSNQVMMRAVISDQSPYLNLEIDSPADRENILLVNFKSEVMIVPDTLSDNYLFFRESPEQNGGLIFPGFNMVVHLLDNGRGMFTCAWRQAGLVSSGRTQKAAGQYYDYCRIEFKGKNRLQLGVPAAEGIWNKVTARPKDNKFEKINWKQPFAAQWLINYSIMNPRKRLFLDESYPVPKLEQKEQKRMMPGIFIIKPDIWQGYEQVNGPFTYPVYIKDGETFLRQMAYGNGGVKINYAGSQIIYAIDALPKSSGEAMMPMPQLKSLLSAEQMKAAQHQPIWKGRGVCGATEEIEKVFEKEKQKEKREYIADRLKGMNEFIVHVNERCKDYRDWGAGTVEWMAEKSKQDTKLVPVCGDLNEILADIQTVWNKNSPIFKKPEDFSKITVQLAALADSGLSGEKQEDECKNIGRQLRLMAGTLHHTLGEYRQTVRAARWYAVHRLMTASGPAEIELLTGFIEKSSQIIRPWHGEEGK